MTDEQRTFTRIPWNVRATLKTGSKIHACVPIQNISAGGCLLELETGLPVGSECEVAIHLMGNDPDFSVHIQGTLQRSETGQTAIRFNSIDPDSLFHLRKILQYNAPDPDAMEEEIERRPGIR